MTKPKIGLVCSGGGARGAYEAGVLRYLREELPRDAGVRFDVLCGTSVGAMTASFIAGSMHEPQTQGQKLADIWTSLSLEKVFRMEGESVFSVGRKIWKATRENLRPEGWRLNDLFHSPVLEEVARQAIDWTNLSANLKKGLVDAVSVTATRIRDGKTVIFVQRAQPGLPVWSRDPHQEPQEVILSAEHALASGAIPILFRSAKVGDEYFCDGFVRQNTPLTPALRLGADRVLILSLRHKEANALPSPALTETPTNALVLGKILSALMADRTSHDLDRLRRINQLLAQSRLDHGAEVADKMLATVAKMRGQPWREVKDLVLRPSRDLSELAKPHLELQAKRLEEGDTFSTKILHRLSSNSLMTQAELGSHILFDGGYASDLISLAMEDTHQKREALLAFFAS
jgi:NTE family protein